MHVFVDTAAWIALFDPSDSLAAAARQVMHTLQQTQQPLLTSEFVLLEVAATFAAPTFRNGIITFINGLYRLPDVTIEAASHTWYQAGWSLYQQRLDKAWSLTDAFTSDRHFEQAGFRWLLQTP